MSSEGFVCDDVKIAASSGLSPVRKAVGGGTDPRDVSVTAWGADRGEAGACCDAELSVARGDATAARLVTSLVNSSGAGALSMTASVAITSRGDSGVADVVVEGNASYLRLISLRTAKNRINPYLAGFLPVTGRGRGRRGGPIFTCTSISLSSFLSCKTL